MTAVENTELVSAQLGRWHPPDLVFLEEVAFAAPPGEASSVRITALFQRRDPQRDGPDLKGAFLRVRLRFGRVTGFRVDGVGGPLQLSGFDIVDVRDLGWEGVRFRVEDFEQGAIGFYCATAAVVDVEPVPWLPEQAV